MAQNPSAFQLKLASLFLLFFILVSASFYKTSSKVWSGVEQQPVPAEAVVSGPVEETRTITASPPSAYETVGANNSLAISDGTTRMDRVDKPKQEVRKKKKTRKASFEAATNCTLLLGVTVLLPEDAGKRKKILLELSMALTSAYLTHKDFRAEAVCFGIITDESTTVTISDQARRSLQVSDTGRKVLDRLEYFRYGDIWEHVKAGEKKVGYNAFGRFKGYRNILQEEASKPAESRRNIVFIDSDLVFIKHIFGFYHSRGPGKEPFDVGLTYRMMPKFPVNTGVMFFHRERMDKGAQFMARVVDIYERKKYPHDALGDQMVMNDVLEVLGKKVDVTNKVYIQRAVDKNGTEVVLVHTDHWNFSPNRYCRVPRRTHIIHFKGDLKEKMYKYYKHVKLSLPKKDPTKMIADLNRFQAEKSRVRPCKY